MGHEGPAAGALRRGEEDGVKIGRLTGHRRFRMAPLICSGAFGALFASLPAGAVPVESDDAPASAAEAPQMPQPAPAVVTRRSEPRVDIGDLPPVRRFVTSHATTVRGQALRYTSIAGETYITNLYGEPTASIFSFSYIVDKPAVKDRPVMFVFNGGPGSSSIWLHMGVVGPRRVVLDREVNPSNLPPFGYRNNPYSLLDVADLVFVDPVGTGFSRAAGQARESDHYGLEEDADANARFIEAWLTEHGRWNSPKYLMGESYGGTRVAVMPRALAGGPFLGGTLRGITLDGIVMVSASLGKERSPATRAVEDGLALPSIAVAGWYHNRVERAGQTAAQYYDEAKLYGLGAYREALERLAAGKLATEEKRATAERLAALTGIAADEWLRRDLRIEPEEARQILLARQDLEIGAYDGRYTMPLAGSGGDPVADDPAMARYTPGFIAAFHQMIRNELGVDMRRPYNAITWVDLNFAWRWERPAGGPEATPVGDLAIAMRRTPGMRLLVANGYYDFVTTPASAEYELAVGQLPKDRIFTRNYQSGHMLYLGETAEAFANDVRAFIGKDIAP